MIRLKKIILSAMVAVLQIGCAKSDIDLPKKTEDGISFRSSVVNSRAQSLTNNAVNPFKSMGIYAAATGSDDYNSTIHNANYLQNVKVERIDATSEWETSRTYNWTEGKTTFFGYAPYNAAGSTITSITPGAPQIDFAVNSNQIEQIDLLIASAVKNATKTPNAITIPMKHALTKIGFSAKLSHDPSEAQHINSIKVTKIEIFGVFSSGKHAMDAEAVWTDLKDIKLESSPFEVNDDANKLGGLSSTNLSTTYQKITLDDGYLFMIPQSFTASAKLRVYVVADWTEGNKEISFDDPIEFDLASTDLEWNQGEAINYNINIDITDHVQINSTITAELVPWNETEIDTDVTNRQLNLTRIEIDVYDSAITRVYFWSNQPKEEVYISPICYEGTLPSAGATAKNIEDIFTNLTATNPWEATNLYYDVKSGEGHFELDRVNSNSAPQNYLLYVYAGGLRRSVQVNIKNSNNLPPTGDVTSQFVGTFHRFDEYGERIITWNNSGPWAAVIEPVNSHRNPDGSGGNADYKDVIFDRYVSPAQEMGILYTENPGNAEDYLVTDMSDKLVQIDGIETRALKGNGKVYMRVGWKKSPIRGVKGQINRYAKITIRDQVDDMNSSKVLGVLYIRKGEEPDYIMRKGDPILGDTYSGNRDDVVQFSPYDVTSPYGNEVKKDYFDYPFIGSGGGAFVKYPSQGGSYFKWGSGRGVSLYTTDLPFGYFNGNVAIPDVWSKAVDVCPDGYRVPAYDSSTESVASYFFPNPYSSLDGLEMVQSMYVKPEQDMVYAPYDWRKHTPYPQDQSANWMFGYYADGYFDRGAITLLPSAYVSYANSEGYDGLLVFNPYSLSSIFLPATGYIGITGLYQPGGIFSMNLTTRISGFPEAIITMQLFKYYNNTFFNLIGQSDRSDRYQLGMGRSIRCVKGDKQDITKDDKYVLYFDVNTYTGMTVIAAAPITGSVNSIVTIPSLPNTAAKEWNTKQDGSGTTYKPGGNFTLNDRFTVLYAIW